MKTAAPLALTLLLACAAVSAQTGLEVPTCLGGGNRFSGDGMKMPPTRLYAELGFTGIDKPHLQELLQAFVASRHGKSYRRLGDFKDFFHGHLLYSEESVAPLAILYHTQEAAAVEHEKNPGGPYDYLDALSRNWLQTSATGKLVNAVTRTRKSYPDSPEWDAFQKNCLPQYLKAKTITPLMLDLAQTPGLARETQFNFLAIDCASAPKDDALNGLKLRLPDASEACLLLGANSR